MNPTNHHSRLDVNILRSESICLNGLHSTVDLKKANKKKVVPVVFRFGSNLLRWHTLYLYQFRCTFFHHHVA